jgi:chromosome segregation ATPase
LPGNEKVLSELASLKNTLQAVDGELAQVQQSIGNLLDSLELGEVVKNRLQARQGQREALEARRKDLGQQIAKLGSTGHDTERQLRSIKDLIEKMAQLEGQERISLRLNLRSQLRRLIAEIKVYPDKGWFGLFFKTGEWRGLTVEDGQVLVMDGKREWKNIPMFFKV